MNYVESKQEVEKIEKQVAIKKETPKKVEPVKTVHKPIPKVESRPIRENYNFSVKTDFRLNSYRGLKKYILLIPEDKFKKVKFSKKSFEVGSLTYKKIERYLFKIKNSDFHKNIDIGEYRISFLIGDGDFFLIEIKNSRPNFRTLNLKNRFQKSYTFSDKNFRYW